MPLWVLSSGRLVAIAGLICLSLAACGRRGALEEPPAPAATAARPSVKKVERVAVPSDPTVATIESDEEEDPAVDASEAIMPTPGPARPRRSRNVTIPKQPFILDPLL